MISVISVILLFTLEYLLLEGYHDLHVKINYTFYIIHIDYEPVYSSSS